MKTAIGLLDLERWFDGDFAAVLDLARLADDTGVDQVTVVDHVVMGEALDTYPYGKFPGTSDYPWLEPITQLAAIAAVTRRIRLSTGILIAPLRSAVLLAKQLATLDVLSRGRIDIGVGVGWQQAEYDASGVPWDGRFGRLEEQVRACRLLWRESPASFHGRHVNFERVHSRPFPLQGERLPLWFGLAPTERNLARIAALGDGWLPMESDPVLLAPAIARLRELTRAQGRDPDALAIRTTIRTLRDSARRPDLDATLAQVPAYAAAGVTMLRFAPSAFCSGPQEFERFLTRIVSAV
jgi:probable F420-dependent oxidoreductase